MSQIVPVSAALAPVEDVWRMASAIAKSGLFGMKTPEEAMALMLVAQAEGRHPASAAQDYHIISGRPSKKADAMLRDFIASGGRVQWHALDDTKADATFSHPSGGEVRINWDHDRAKAAGINNPMWRKYPRQMLRSRVVSEGVRTVCPGATSGMYVPEEVQDFEPVTVQVNDDLPATPQPRKSSAQAKRDGDYERLTGGLRACQDEAELTAWAASNKDAIGAVPVKWQNEIRDEWVTLRDGFRAKVADPNDVFIEPPPNDAPKVDWEAYLDTVLQAVMGSPSITEVEDVQATNGSGIERLALLIEDAPERIAAIAEQRIAELTAKAA